jgi:purine-nucleoside phosphorylase
METASTFAVAQHFGMRRVSLLFAFDNPCRGEHILTGDAEKSQRREQGEQAMIKMAFVLIKSC